MESETRFWRSSSVLLYRLESPPRRKRAPRRAWGPLPPSTARTSFSGCMAVTNFARVPKVADHSIGMAAIAAVFADIRAPVGRAGVRTKFFVQHRLFATHS
jgi:hypothetical protein